MEILKRLLIGIAIPLLLFSCQEREEPIIADSTPELYLKGRLGQESFEYFAGVNGFSAEPASFRDIENTFWFGARISSEEFGLNIDLKNLDEGTIDINSSLAEGQIITSTTQIEEFYEVQFTTNIFTQIASYSWDFGDGNISEESDPVHRYPISNDDYTVCLNTEDVNGCTNELCYIIRPYQDKQVDILTSNPATSTGLWLLEAIETNFEGIAYKWTIDDQFTIETKELALSSEVNNPVRKICLDVTTKSNQIVSKCIQLKTDLSSTECVLNFDYKSNSVTDTVESTTGIRIFDANLQSSEMTYQIIENPQNEMNILESVPYKTFTDGSPTQRVKFTLNALVIDNSGVIKELVIEEGNLAFGVSD